MDKYCLLQVQPVLLSLALIGLDQSLASDSQTRGGPQRQQDFPQGGKSEQSHVSCSLCQKNAGEISKFLVNCSLSSIREGIPQMHTTQPDVTENRANLSL